MLIIVVLSWLIWMMRGRVHANREWKHDLEMEILANSVVCDFPVINGLHFKSLKDLPYSDIPLVITNLTDEWTAHQNWTKESLLVNYGTKKIRSGSEASIVYSGGNAEFASALSAFIESFGNESRTSLQDQFLFDTTILNAIPELNQDFSVPHLFQDWDQPTRENNHEIWHMLSLGPSRAGLAFHNHGRTWIAVIHGMKRWFIYPPGFNPPLEIDLRFPPTLSARQWFEDYYPLLENLSSRIFQREGNHEEGYPPLECVQRPGDILYLPDLWSHLTLNIGETIAIGAQEAIGFDQRYSIAKAAYTMNPLNYEALKDVGLSIYSQQLYELERYRQSLVFLSNNIIHLPTLEAFNRFRAFTQDSMILIHYFNNSRNSLSYQQIVQELQNWKRTNEIDVILLPFSDNPASCQSDGAIYQLEIYESSQVLETEIDKLAAGLEEEVKYESLLVKSLEIASIEDFPSEEILLSSSSSLPLVSKGPSSIHGIPVRVREKLQVAIKYLKGALDVKPLQPEALQILSEIYIMLGDSSEVQSLLSHAEKVYDQLPFTQRASNRTIASLYYKLAMLSDQIEDTERTLRLLQKTLATDEELLSAWQSYYTLLEERGELSEIVRSFDQRLSVVLGPLLKEEEEEGSETVQSLSAVEIQALLAKVIQQMY